MLQAICNHISKQLILGGVIKEEEKTIYDYGIYLALMTIISTSTIVVLGIIWGKLGLTILFLIVIASLRHYTGGYHASQYWRCYLMSCIAYGIVIYFASHQILLGTIYLPLIVSGAIIYSLIIGSLNSDKNPKTPDEMIFRAKRARITIGIYSIVILFGILFKVGEVSIWLVIAWSQVIVMLSLLIAKIQRRYFKWKLKKQC